MTTPLSRRPVLIVFDLDGTLVDSAPDLHGAIVSTLADDGRAAITLDDARRFIGDGTRRFVERAYAPRAPPWKVQSWTRRRTASSPTTAGGWRI